MKIFFNSVAYNPNKELKFLLLLGFQLLESWSGKAGLRIACMKPDGKTEILALGGTLRKGPCLFIWAW